jgi:2-amino-4-hydroxy-6-hydroxymethyldihydropteridine diphosphokinase
VAEAWLSLGGNIGDRKRAVDEAVERLGRLPATRVTARSSYYRTAPVGPVAQDWFVNLCVAIETGLGEAALRSACREIEAAMGRDRAKEISWGPRIIDLDVIARSDAPDAPPHRELTRGYVIVPLAEIAPDLVIGGRAVGEILAHADATGVERLDWLSASSEGPGGARR